MHTRHVKGCNIPPDPGNGVYPSAFADLLVYGSRLPGPVPSGKPVSVKLLQPFNFAFRIVLQRNIMPVKALSVLIAVSGELLRQVWVIELHLRLRVIAEYNAGGQHVGCVVYGHPGNVRQDLPSPEIALQVIEHRFRCQNIIIAVCRNLCPPLFRNRLVPWQSQFLVVDSQFDFPFLQALLLCRKVVYVRVRNIIGVSEHGVAASADNPLAQPV